MLGVEKSVPSIRILPTEQYFALVRQQLSENGQAFVRVTGNSMWPLLHHLRDGVIIVPSRSVQQGDIVLFDRQNGRYALHRVICAGENGFIMAGDHQWHVEKDLPYNQIIGVVAAIQRKGRLIPRENFFQRIYARMMATLAFPRIRIRNALVKLVKPFIRPGNTPGEGANS